MLTATTVFLLLTRIIITHSSNDEYEVQIDTNDILPRSSLFTLEYVAVITRHGSRSPINTYPNDPYPYNNSMFWPSGPGELTNFGRRQLYQTGEKLRARYNGFLPETFFPNDTVVKYNNYNRDFMSAACLLAGIYPPKGRAIWDPNLLWQPIPMYIRKFDVCDLSSSNICPAFKNEGNSLLDKYNEMYNAKPGTAQLFSTLTQYLGFNVTKASQLSFVHDTLQMQLENGFKLPGWAEKYFPEPLRTIEIEVMNTLFTGSDYLIKLGAGPELKRIAELLTMKANKTFNEQRKFYIEAVHDCTLLSLMKGLGQNITNLEIQTSAYMIFELHYLPEMYIVQVFYYKNSSDDNPEYVNIRECPNPCSLENFTKYIATINLPDFKTACLGK